MSFGSTSRAAPAKKEEKPAKKEAEPVKAGKGQNTSGKAIKEEASPAPAPSKAASVSTLLNHPMSTADVADYR